MMTVNHDLGGKNTGSVSTTIHHIFLKKIVNSFSILESYVEKDFFSSGFPITI